MELLSSWDQEYNPSDSFGILKVLARKHSRMAVKLAKNYSNIGTDLAVKRADVKHLCTSAIELSAEDQHAQSLYHQRQALAFFSKNPSIELGIDRKEVSRQSFMDAESLCKVSNDIFKQWSKGNFQFSPAVETQFFLAQRKIATVLGDVPSLNQLGLRFGPGSTTLTKKRNANHREKIHAGLACSEELVPIVRDVIDEFPVWREFLLEQNASESLPVKVDLGKVTFVPKSAKTDRAVVTEPVLNGMLQLGYGDFIAKRLRAVGVDISDQSLNQRLALEGSLTGDLATLDLSSASDTISTELIFNLLPVDWALALSRCRTRSVKIGNEVIRQEKFASMGNGFTFPLETLVFWALARACCDNSETVSVYGDDIIVPSHRAAVVSNLLHCAGFVVNIDKSFSSGPFRESCGADYYKGIDVRPYYQKDLVGPATLFCLHNYYVRRGLDDFAVGVLEFIHPDLLIFGPDGYGDGHLLGEFVAKPHKRDIGYSGFTFKTYTWKSRRDLRKEMPGDYILPLYHVYVRDPLNDARVRNNPDGSHERRRFYHGAPTEYLERRNTFPGKLGYKMISIYIFNKE